MNIQRSEYLANEQQAHPVIEAIARRMAVEQTRADWRAVLAARDAKRDSRRNERRAHPRNVSGRVSIALVQTVAAICAAVSAYFGG